MSAHIDCGGEPRCAQYLRTGGVHGAGRSDLSLDPVGRGCPGRFRPRSNLARSILCCRPGTCLPRRRPGLQESSVPQTPAQAEGWIAGTSPAMTVAAEFAVLPKLERR